LYSYSVKLNLTKNSSAIRHPANVVVMYSPILPSIVRLIKRPVWNRTIPLVASEITVKKLV